MKLTDILEHNIDANELDENWKNWVAAGAIGAASLGAHGANSTPQHNNIVQQHKYQQELNQTTTKNPLELILKRAAKSTGMAGNELAAFLSQCAHETLDFKHLKEIGGKLDFKKYDIRFNPAKAKSLGNVNPGDGAKYRGRGYIQLTGRANYKLAGEALGLPLEKKPELVENPEIAAKVAIWYWKERVHNNVKNFKDTTDVTRTINPGLKDLDKRKAKFSEFQLAANL